MTDEENALALLRSRNPELPLHTADSPAFSSYGRVLTCPDTARLVEALKREAPIGEGTAYQRSVTGLEDAECPEGGQTSREGQTLGRPGPLPHRTWKQYLGSVVFGGLPVQIGWCAGRNSRLNALEYHKSSEVLVAGTDLLLLLGFLWDLERHRSYQASRVQGFLVRKGQAVETWATTLHFAPVMVDASGFRAAIALPAETNAPLPGLDPAAEGEAGLLWAVNKWLIACPGSGPAKKGARVAVDRNIEVNL